MPNIDSTKLITKAQKKVQEKAIFDNAVNNERDRRIAAGFVFNNVVYQSDRSSRDNIRDNSIQAFMAVVGGADAGNLRWVDETSDFYWIAADNTLVGMDAPTMIDFGKAAVVHKSRLIMKARDIKAASPQPADITKDSLW